MSRRHDWEMKEINLISSICDSIVIPKHLARFGNMDRTQVTQTFSLVTGQLDVLLSVLAILAALLVALVFL